jgi:hypothetical protein
MAHFHRQELQVSYTQNCVCRRANGAKRRARVLIAPAIYTRGNESISEV